jgi:hypothetical protein
MNLENQILRGSLKFLQEEELTILQKACLDSFCAEHLKPEQIIV